MKDEVYSLAIQVDYQRAFYTFLEKIFASETVDLNPEDDHSTREILSWYKIQCGSKIILLVEMYNIGKIKGFYAFEMDKDDDEQVVVTDSGGFVMDFSGHNVDEKSGHISFLNKREIIQKMDEFKIKSGGNLPQVTAQTLIGGWGGEKNNPISFDKKHQVFYFNRKKVNKGGKVSIQELVAREHLRVNGITSRQGQNMMWERVLIETSKSLPRKIEREVQRQIFQRTGENKSRPGIYLTFVGKCKDQMKIIQYREQMLFTQDNVTKLDVKQIAEDMQEIKECLGLIDIEVDNLSGFETSCGDNIGLDIRSCFKTYFTGLEEIYEEAPEVTNRVEFKDLIEDDITKFGEEMVKKMAYKAVSKLNSKRGFSASEKANRIRLDTKKFTCKFLNTCKNIEDAYLCLKQHHPGAIAMCKAGFEDYIDQKKINYVSDKLEKTNNRLKEAEKDKKKAQAELNRTQEAVREMLKAQENEKLAREKETELISQKEIQRKGIPKKKARKEEPEEPKTDNRRSKRRRRD